MDVFKLKGETAIITGGAGVIGTHFANILSEAGVDVIILDLDQKKCDKIASELKEKHHTNPLGISCDLTKKDSIQEAVSVILAKYKKIDVLINNAVIKSKNYFAELPDYSLDEWNEVMDVNVTAMFLMAQACIPHMKPGSTVVNMSSIYGIVGPQKELYDGMSNKPAPAIYCVSKGGVIMLTKWLAAMYGDKGIRANTITPGGVSENQFGGNDFEKKYSARTPLRKMTTLADLTGPILFLASDASSGITGHNLVVDGGWTIV